MNGLRQGLLDDVEGDVQVGGVSLTFDGGGRRGGGKDAFDVRELGVVSAGGQAALTPQPRKHGKGLEAELGLMAPELAFEVEGVLDPVPRMDEGEVDEDARSA
jgi:hypothetical protein